MSNITEKLYCNLVRNFNHVVEEVLGKDYHNMGMDVYSTHDNCARDLIREYDRLKDENKRLTGDAIALFIGFLLSIIFNLYLVILVTK